MKPCAYLIPTSTATAQMVCVKMGCIRREPQPVSQKNRGIRAEGLSPVCTPPPAGGGKINTEFTKSGPVISPTAVKELLSAQSNGNQPGTLPLPCPRELRSRCCWGHPARTDPIGLSQLLMVLSQLRSSSGPTTYRLSRRPAKDVFPPPWETTMGKKNVPDRLTEFSGSRLLKKEREKGGELRSR